MTKLTSLDIDHIAKLVKLQLTDEEKAKLVSMFSETLDYIDMLGELDTSNVSETFQVTGMINVFQTDEAPTTLAQKDAIKNATKSKDGLFVTKGVFDR